MNRYYISARSGTGSDNDPWDSPLREFVWGNYQIRPLQQVYAPCFPYWIHKFDLTQAQHDAAIAAVSGVFTFPAGALDRQLSTIQPAQRTAIENKLNALGFNTTWLTGDHTIRDVLQFICHAIQLCMWTHNPASDFAALAQLTDWFSGGNFNIQTMTAGDLSPARQNMIIQHMIARGISTAGLTQSTNLWQIVRRLQRLEDDLTPRIMPDGRRCFYHDEAAE